MRFSETRYICDASITDRVIYFVRVCAKYEINIDYGLFAATTAMMTAVSVLICDANEIRIYHEIALFWHLFECFMWHRCMRTFHAINKFVGWIIVWSWKQQRQHSFSARHNEWVPRAWHTTNSTNLSQWNVCLDYMACIVLARRVYLFIIIFRLRNKSEHNSWKRMCDSLLLVGVKVNCFFCHDIQVGGCIRVKKRSPLLCAWPWTSVFLFEFEGHGDDKVTSFHSIARMSHCRMQTGFYCYKF